MYKLCNVIHLFYILLTFGFGSGILGAIADQKFSGQYLPNWKPQTPQINIKKIKIRVRFLVVFNFATSNTFMSLMIYILPSQIIMRRAADVLMQLYMKHIPILLYKYISQFKQKA